MKSFRQLLNEAYESMLLEDFKLGELASDDQSGRFKENPVEILINWFDGGCESHNVGQTLGILWTAFNYAKSSEEFFGKKIAIRKRPDNVIDINTKEQLYESAIKKKYIAEFKFPIKLVDKFVKKASPNEIEDIIQSVIIDGENSPYMWQGSQQDIGWRKIDPSSVGTTTTTEVIGAKTDVNGRIMHTSKGRAKAVRGQTENSEKVKIKKLTLFSGNGRGKRLNTSGGKGAKIHNGAAWGGREKPLGASYIITKKSPAVKILVPETQACVYVIKSGENYVFVCNSKKFNSDANSGPYGATTFANFLKDWECLNGFSRNTAI